MVWSPTRTSQKQPCPRSHSQGRHWNRQLQWLSCGQESGSKLSSVITAFVCELAGQSLGNVFPICHSCTSGVTSTHASYPSICRANLGSVPQPLLLLAVGSSQSSSWLQPSHVPSLPLSLLRPTADSRPQENWTVWP